MQRRLITLLALLLATFTAPSWAITVQVTGGAESAIPVAIVPFLVEGNSGPPPEDIAGIITNDLRRSGKFETLPLVDMRSRPSRAGEVEFSQWQALGRDAVVVGGVRRLDNGEYDVRFELVDIYRKSRILDKSYTSSAGALRNTAHMIADLVHEALTGQPGAFNTQIVYVQANDTGAERSYHLMLADADGARPRAILNSTQPIMAPAWSPDARQVAYVSFEGKRSEVWVQNVASGQRRKVASFPGLNSAPAWAPDGRRLALSLSKDGNPDIYILDLDTGRLQQITRHWSIDTEPVWTPDGSALVFTSDRGGKPQVYRVSTRGGEPERLTFVGSYNANPDLSPDGRWLATVHSNGRGFQIAVMDLETRQVRTLTQGPLDEAPSFAPNGAYLIYTQAAGQRPRLATVSVYGRADQPLGTSPHAVREAAWSPR